MENIKCRILQSVENRSPSTQCQECCSLKETFADLEKTKEAAERLRDKYQSKFFKVSYIMLNTVKM